MSTAAVGAVMEHYCNVKAIEIFTESQAGSFGNRERCPGQHIAGMAGMAQTLTPVTTALGWIPNAEYAGLWVGIENGYFAEEGIDLKYTPGGPNAPGVLVSLAAGNAQYAGGDWMPFLEAVEKGNDFVVLGAAFPTSPAALLSLAKKPVRGPKDLVGARILNQMPADKNTVDYILTKAGLPLEYEMVPTGFSPEPLLAGDGDVYFAFATNQPITLENMGMKEGTDFFVTLMDGMGYSTPAGIIVADKKYVAENRPLGVFYMIYVATTSGLTASSATHRDVFRALGATAVTRFWRLDLPAALPAVVSGMKLAVPVAFIGGIVGEWFGASRGLGPLMVSAMQNFQIPLLWSAVLIMTITSLVLFGLMSLLERLTYGRYQ